MEQIEREVAQEVLEQQKASSKRKVTITEVINEHKKIVVLGNPGAGKTTLLKYIVLILAQGQGHRFNLPRNTLPIYINLYRFISEQRQRNQDYTLLDYLRTQAKESLILDLPDNFFKDALEQGNCFICLDGLDELGTVGSRKDTIKVVAALVNRYRQNRYMVTSRRVGYDEAPLNYYDFTHYTLLPFNDEDISAFIRKWYRARERDLNRAEQQAQQLTYTILSEPRIQELATNPLMLTIIALVHRIEAELPNQRVRLYEKCVITLVDTWEQVKQLKHEDRNRPYYKYRIRLLEQLAYWLHSTISKRGESREIKEGVLKQKLAQFLIEMRQLYLDEETAWQEAESFIELIKSRTGVLVKYEESYRFVHLTFQEYLAARDIRKRTLFGGETALWQEIEPRLHDPHWREVLLLLMGSFDDDELPTRLTQRILNQTDRYETIIHRHLYLVTRILADHIDVAVHLHDQIIDHLLQLAEQNDQGSFDAIHALRFLTGNERAAIGLVRVALNPEISADLRRFAVEAIIVMGFYSDGIELLHRLATDRALDMRVRLEIIEQFFELERPGWPEIVAEILQELAEKKGLKDDSVTVLLAKLLIKLKRPDAAAKVLINYLATISVEFWGFSYIGKQSNEALQMLKELDRSQEVGNLLASIAWREHTDFNKTIPVLHKLKDWGPIDEHHIDQLKQLVLDRHLDSYLRVCAAEGLANWGREAEAIQTEMLNIMQHKQSEPFTRANAAYVLGIGGQPDQASRFLLNLLWHKQLDEFDDLNSDVCRFLRNLSDASPLVLPGLRMAAIDQSVNAGGRYYAAEALIELEQIEDGQKAFFMLLHNESVEDWIRLYAASALLEIAQFPEAIEVLYKLANDTSVEAWIRADTAKILARTGQKVSLAPALLAIAHNPGDYNFRDLEIIETLMELGVVEELVILFKDWLSDPNISDLARYRWAFNLAKLDHIPEAVKVFLELARNKSETENVKVRFDSIMQLGKLGAMDESISNTLLELVSNEEQWVRHAAYVSLKSLLDFEVI